MQRYNQPANKKKYQRKLKAVFKKDANLRLILSEKVERIQEILEQQKWLIYTTYQNYNWKAVFEHMVRCQAFQIWLHWNNHPQIIKQIQHVEFASLRILWLLANNILNIQPLSHMNFRKLQDLSLSDNHISRISCINKWSLSSLNSLLLRHNPLSEISSLARSKINAVKLKDLNLGLYQEDKVVNQDISVIVKVGSKSIEKLWIHSKFRIAQPKLQTMLNPRFPRVKIKNERNRWFYR